MKSPPELWTELSDQESLARHLEALGEIRITRTEPEELVEWEADGAQGTVRIKPSAWGTRVTLAATRETRQPGAVSVAEPSAQPVAEPRAEAAAEPTPEPVAEPRAEASAEPTPEPVAEPRAEASAGPGAEPGIQGVAESAAEADPESAAEATAEPGAEALAGASIEPAAEAGPEAEDPVSISEEPAERYQSAGLGPATEAARRGASHHAADAAAAAAGGPAEEPSAVAAGTPVHEPAAPRRGFFARLFRRRRPGGWEAPVAAAQAESEPEATDANSEDAAGSQDRPAGDAPEPAAIAAPVAADAGDPPAVEPVEQDVPSREPAQDDHSTETAQGTPADPPAIVLAHEPESAAQDEAAETSDAPPDAQEHERQDAGAEAVRAEPQPPEDGSAAQRISAELLAAEEVESVLTAVLDRLGAAHHRPFSRS